MSRSSGPDPFASRPGRRSEILHHLLPVLLSLGLYANLLPGDFIFDDIVLLEDEHDLRDIQSERIFRKNYWGDRRNDPNYRPLTLLSYALNFRLGESAWCFRLLNILLNAAAVYVFYRVARLLFADRRLALAAACLYAAFPIRIEAVANIVGRAEILAALAIFGAWLAVQGAERREGIRRPLIAAGIIFLGMFCKENTAAAVALIPLAMYFSRGMIAWRTGLASAAAVVGYFIVRRAAMGDILDKLGAGRATLIDNPLASVDPLTRILNAIRLLGLYVWKTLVPVHLSADYSFNQLPVWPASSPLLWIAAAAILGAGALAVVLLRRRVPLAALGILFFAAAIVPVSNIIIPIGTIFGERLAYTPAAGLAIAAAAFLGTATRRGPLSGAPSAAWAIPVAIAVVLYGARTMRRNLDWADRYTMNLRMVEDAPRSSRSHVKAAEAHVMLSRKADGPAEKERRLRLAIVEVGTALKIYPRHAHALAFLGETLIEAGRFTDAVETLDRAEAMFKEVRLPVDPGVFKLRLGARLRLAQQARGEGAGDSAAALYRAALEDARLFFEAAGRSGRAYAEVLSQRAIARAELGDPQGARADLDDAIAAAPGYPNLYNNRGYLRLTTGDARGAIDDYRIGQRLCEEKGRMFEPPEENVLLFRMRIFDALIQIGDRAGAEAELGAIRAMGPRVPAQVLVNLEARLRGRSPGSSG